MNDDEFDLRLRQAVRPLVTEIVPRSVAQDLEAATWRRTAFGAGLPAAIAIVLVAVFAGAFSLSRGAAVIGPGTFPSPAVETVAHGTKIATPDGEVFVRTSADGAHLELVLEKDAATSLVLVSIDERMPAGNVSFGSVHLVDCPPSTGLVQQYYVLGQNTFGGTVVSGTVVLHGLAGTAAEMAGGRYLIAITSTSIPPDRWTFDIRGQESGGALGSSFLNLPTYGQKSAAGCFFNAQ
jgi:hypothetical protein